MSERTIDEERIREEHLRQVKPVMQLAYLLGVLVGGMLLMLVLIALLGSAG